VLGCKAAEPRRAHDGDAVPREDREFASWLCVVRGSPLCGEHLTMRGVCWLKRRPWPHLGRRTHHGGVGADAVDEGAEAVRALRGEVGAEVKLAEHGFGVGR